MYDDRVGHRATMPLYHLAFMQGGFSFGSQINKKRGKNNEKENDGS